MTSFIRTATISLILCVLILLGYWRLTIDLQHKAIVELQAMNKDLENRLAARQAMVDRLSRSRRIAHLKVLKQDRSETDPDTVTTHVQFIELDENGRELGQREFVIPGDVLFVDAWTVKFDYERVAEGHPLMGRTLVLLRRVYSDVMRPRDGFEIDTPGAVPPGYAATDVGRFEKQLWESFWDIATDAETAKRMGVRVAQGEAVYKPVRAGQTFELSADAVGGITLRPMSADEIALTRAKGD